MSKKKLKNVSKNAGRSWEGGENVDTAFAFRSPKAALTSLPEVIRFYHTGKGLNLGKFNYFKNILFSVPMFDYSNNKVIPVCAIRKKWLRTEVRKEIQKCENF